MYCTVILNFRPISKNHSIARNFLIVFEKTAYAERCGEGKLSDRLGCIEHSNARVYEGNSISKLQIVIEKNRMEIMTYKQRSFFNIISTQI
jgi:ribosomal protein L16/L10AE